MTFKSTLATDIFAKKYRFSKYETWRGCAKRVTKAVCGALPTTIQEDIFQLIWQRKFIPGGRYLYYAGRPKRFFQNCYAFRAEDSREGWADVGYKAFSALMTGGGIGYDYSDLREESAPIAKTGGVSSGPPALIKGVDGIGQVVMQGGARRSAIWAGLVWDHPDIWKYLTAKNTPGALEFTNISVIYDHRFWHAMNDEKDPKHGLASKVWAANMLQACKTAEPGFAFNYDNPHESLRNACGELTSEDDSDRCNLGSVFLNRHTSQEDLAHTIDCAAAFLLAGGKIAENPTEKIAEVGRQNNRIGIGLSGIHGWLMQRWLPYEVGTELRRYLETYQEQAERSGKGWARYLQVNEPKATRAIAPNGTIGILAESSCGIEPLFCAAYRRRYLRDNVWHYQYVIDETAKRLVDSGVPLELVEASDAYALDFEQRVKFQADVQKYVDMAISSTCNLHAFGTEKNSESEVVRKGSILLKYSPQLRGFTCYPDGAREGQPIEKVSIGEARMKEGHIYKAGVSECVGGVCGA
jgi:ribonucleoside-diphosphate reductase alpha chain